MALATDNRGVLLACRSCGQRNRISFAHLTGGVRCGQCKTTFEAVEAPVDISSSEMFDRLIAEAVVPVVVDFWAEWCGPCRMVAPELEKVAKRQAGRLVVAKLDTERFQDLARRFDVRSIPMLAVFAGGRRVATEVGARPAADIEAFVSGATQS